MEILQNLPPTSMKIFQFLFLHLRFLPGENVVSKYHEVILLPIIALSIKGMRIFAIMIIDR